MNTRTLPERFIAPSAASGTAAVLARHGFKSRLLLVADANTWAAAGAPLTEALGSNFQLTQHIFPAGVHASVANALEVIRATADVDGILAIGSGTINDLCKYASAQCDLPYAVFATAASMNGYTSTTASLAVDGFKHSHAARAPKAVIVDPAVIAAAPRHLTHAGLGDALCRSTVELDMMLSHFLRQTPYPQALFEKLWSHEEGIFENAEGFKTQSPKAMKLLMAALLDGGDAMTEHGSSAVASQGEHMIAHTAEMLMGDKLLHLTHGQVIAITTLTMGRLQNSMLDTQPQVKALPRDAALFRQLFGGASAPALHATYSQKILGEEDVDAINYVLDNSWKEIGDALREVMLPPKQLQAFFEQAGVPTRPEDVKMDVAAYEQAVAHAYLTRERFTFLDLAAMQA